MSADSDAAVVGGGETQALAGGGLELGTVTYFYDAAMGTYTRTGPDGHVTTVQTDLAGRVDTVERRATAGGALLMSADYDDYADDRVLSITYSNGASVLYSYDEAKRVGEIDHRDNTGALILALAYTYSVNDLPSSILEWGPGVPVGSGTFFTYDAHNRLISEEREGPGAYALDYTYDAGGNRKQKRDFVAQRLTEYHYDVENPYLYGSNNNRLEYSETFQMIVGNATGFALSTTWYTYTAAGNVDRVITRDEPTCDSGSQQNAMAGGGGEEGN